MAFRLIFESDGNEIRLIRKSRVDMIAPAPPTDADQRSPGVFAEVRNDRDETMYQTNVSAQLQPTVEVFAPDAPIERVDAPNQKRVVVIVIPDPPDARSLVLVRRGGEEAVGAEEHLLSEGVTIKHELVRIPLVDKDLIE